MERKEIIRGIDNALRNTGCILPEKLGDDYAVIEYIADSLQFISFVVELEEVLGIPFPDELLNIELLESRNGFASILESLCKEQEALLV